MLIDEIFKTQDFASLKKEWDNNNFPSALLLISKDDVYLREFAKAVAMLIFDGKIDVKSANSVKVLAGSHPDLKIYPSKDKLVMADSEEIGDESHLKPIFADKKVFIVNNFDISMEGAQNKLLKTLEEPSKNVYLILTCSNLNLVLPTIRSRCNKIELDRLDSGTILKSLPKLDNRTQNNILACSDGMIGRALYFAKMKNSDLLCSSCVDVFVNMKNSKQVLSYSKQLLAFKDDFVIILDIFSIIVEDLLKIKSGRGDLVKLSEFNAELSGCAPDYTVRALCQIAPLIDKTMMEKSYNVNQTIAVENLLLNILEVKYLCK